MTESICPICRHPKTANNEGRLTQWMLICRCDRPLTEAEEAVVVNLCRTCGKRVGEGRAGSLTQFIFRFDTCTCEHPNPEMRRQSPLNSAVSPESLPTDDELDSENEEPIAGEELTGVDEGFPRERYKPLKILGSGTSGVVYLAKDKLLKKNVAVKILRNLAATQLVSFQEEARTTSRLKHQNIVEVDDFAVAPNGAPYMVLEYVDGISLKCLMEREGPLSYIACIPLFQQICEGLKYAHSHGIFHRDIKPSNILLSEDADGSTVVRLIDFGLASVMNQERDVERGLTLAGTPYYMSPDQARNKTFDERSEVYGVGCVLYEALTGLPPFRGTTALETLSMHAELVPPSLVEGFESFSKKEPGTGGDELLPVIRDFPPGRFPEALETVIKTCLAKNPSDRFQSMDELKEALTDLYSLVDSPGLDAQDHAIEESRKQLKTANASGAKFLSKPQLSIMTILLTVSLIALTGAIAFLMVEGNLTKQPAQAPSNDAKESDGTGRLIKDGSTTVGFSASRSPLDLIKTNEVNLNLNASLNQESVQDLRLYKNLTSLDLSNNEIDDSALSYVNGRRINYMDLSNTNVHTLEYVARMPALVNLNLAGTKVDNEAMKRISQLNVLALDIRETQIDDGAVETLGRMPCLATLGLANSKISEEGIKRLLYMRPELVAESYKNEVISINDPMLLPQNRPNNLALLEKKLKKAIEVIGERRGKDDPILTYYYWNLSGVCYGLGKKKEWNEYYDRTLELADKHDVKRILLHACKGRFDESSAKKNWKEFVDYGSRFCELQFELNPPTDLLVEQIFTVSEAAWKIKNEQDSTKQLLQLLAVTKEMEENGKLSNKIRATYIAWSYMRLGSRAEAKNNLNDAESYYRKAIAAFRSEEMSNHAYFADLANTYRTLAAMCFANGKLQDAVKFDEKALTIYKNEHMDDYYNQTLKMLEFHQEKLRESLVRKAI